MLVLKKAKTVTCGAPRCANRAEKNSNIIALEYVHIRGETKSNCHAISFQLKISLPCSVSSLHVFT